MITKLFDSGVGTIQISISGPPGNLWTRKGSSAREALTQQSTAKTPKTKYTRHQKALTNVPDVPCLHKYVAASILLLLEMLLAERHHAKVS